MFKAKCVPAKGERNVGNLIAFYKCLEQNRTESGLHGLLKQVTMESTAADEEIMLLNSNDEVGDQPVERQVRLRANRDDTRIIVRRNVSKKKRKLVQLDHKTIDFVNC